MPRPSHPPRLHYSNNTWRRAQIKKLLKNWLAIGKTSWTVHRWRSSSVWFTTLISVKN
jgi:hypothetical protein